MPACYLPHLAFHNLFTTYHALRTTYRIIPDAVNNVLGGYN